MVISNHSRHPSHNIWLYINRCHLSLEFPHSGRTVKKGKDSSPTYRSNCTLNEVSLKPNVWLNLYKCAIHLNTWKPELASVHRQHVEARLNYAHRILSSSTGKGTQRRQVANCFGESMHIHTHTDSCADTAARESRRDKMFVLQETLTLYCMCPCGRWRRCGEGFVCLSWAMHGCVCPSHVQQP